MINRFPAFLVYAKPSARVHVPATSSLLLLRSEDTVFTRCVYFLLCYLSFLFISSSGGMIEYVMWCHALRYDLLRQWQGPLWKSIGHAPLWIHRLHTMREPYDHLREICARAGVNKQMQTYPLRKELLRALVAWRDVCQRGGYVTQTRRVVVSTMRGWRNIEIVLFQISNSMKPYPSAFHAYIERTHLEEVCNRIPPTSQTITS